MPALLDTITKECGIPKAEVEKLWQKAKGIAKKDKRKETDSDFYPFTVGILKKMISKECTNTLQWENLNRAERLLSKIEFVESDKREGD